MTESALYNIPLRQEKVQIKMIRKVSVGLIFLLCCPIYRLHSEDYNFSYGPISQQQHSDCYSEYWQKFFGECGRMIHLL